MFHHEERPLRQQLVDARTAIVTQLDKMYHPVCQGTVRRPPDFSSEIAELESQLNEIDELLAAGDKGDA